MDNALEAEVSADPVAWLRVSIRLLMDNALEGQHLFSKRYYEWRFQSDF